MRETGAPTTTAKPVARGSAVTVTSTVAVNETDALLAETVQTPSLPVVIRSALPSACWATVATVLSETLQTMSEIEPTTGLPAALVAEIERLTFCESKSDAVAMSTSPVVYLRQYETNEILVCDGGCIDDVCGAFLERTTRQYHQ
jgi:hypothetical protein